MYFLKLFYEFGMVIFLIFYFLNNFLSFFKINFNEFLLYIYMTRKITLFLNFI